MIGTKLHWDPGSGERDEKLIVEQVQDVEAIVRENVEAYNDPAAGWSKSREMVHIARVPTVNYLQMCKELGVSVQQSFTDPSVMPKLMAKLHDPAYRKFRTVPGCFLRRPDRQHYRPARLPVIPDAG